jgi:4-alpha-glucanotransferase
VAYSGTHDNDTLTGWLFNPSGGELSKGADVRRRCGQVAKYLHHGMGGRKRLRFAVLQSIYQSRAGWVVIPVQDILGLGSEARINRPGTASGNWEWRTEKGLLTERAAEELRSLSLESGRVMK